MTPGDRVDWVDTAKGICIVFVVMMHSTLGVEAVMGREGFMHWVVAFAKPFRMPDFFMISGLFLARAIDRDWRTYADKRVLHFIYFYLLWLLIQSGFKYADLSGGDPVGFVSHLAWGLVEPFSTLWFIYILAIFSVVTKALRRVPNHLVLVVAAALQILRVDTPWFLLNEFCERWVYFLVGYMFAPWIFGIARRAAARSWSASLALAGWAGLNGLLSLTSTGSIRYPTPAELPVIGFFLGIAGALAIVSVASLVTRASWAKPLRYCGRNSISIYLAFFLPMAVTRTLLIRTGIRD
jgi:uncharacterized membrane protein YcfT